MRAEMRRQKRKWFDSALCIGTYVVSRRLYFPMIGGPFLPIGLFWFAWYEHELIMLFNFT